MKDLPALISGSVPVAIGPFGPERDPSARVGRLAADTMNYAQFVERGISGNASHFLAVETASCA